MLHEMEILQVMKNNGLNEGDRFELVDSNGASIGEFAIKPRVVLDVQPSNPYNVYPNMTWILHALNKGLLTIKRTHA